MPYVTLHALDRFEDRFPQQAARCDRERICRIIRDALVSATLLRDIRDGSRIYLVKFGREPAVVVVKRRSVVTVLTVDEYLNVSKPNESENTFRSWIEKSYH